MFATLVSATLFAVLATRGVLADEFSIATPAQFVQCQKVSLTWSKAQAPYNLAIVPSANPCGDVISELGDYNAESAEWLVNIPVSDGVMLSLLDNNDNEAWSGSIKVVAGNDTSCLTSASSSAVSSASASSSSSAASSSASGSAGSGTLYIGGSSASRSVAASSSTSAAVANGAANAGIDPLSSGSFASRQLPAAATILGVVAAIAAFTL